MPYPTHNEDKQDYIARFMRNKEAKQDYPDEKQRVAVAYSLWKERHKEHMAKSVAQLNDEKN